VATASVQQQGVRFTPPAGGKDVFIAVNTADRAVSVTIDGRKFNLDRYEVLVEEL
jgi:hypothetical protein